MKPRLLSYFVVASFSLVAPALAAQLYWDNEAGTGIWTNAVNWSTAAAGGAGTDPVSAPGASDIATFNVTSLTHTITAPQTVTLGGNVAVGGIAYTGQSQSLTLASGGGTATLSLGADGIKATGAGTSTNSGGANPTIVLSKVFTINNTVAVSLTASQSWEANYTGGLQTGDGIFVAGTVSLGVAGANTLTLGGVTGSSIQNTVSGVVSDGGTDRSLSIRLNGGSGNRWTLSGNNTYTGVTTVSAGALTLGHINALGSTAGNTVVQDGAGVFFRSALGTMAAEAITLSGTGPDAKGALRVVSGNNTWTGAITLASATVAIGADANVFTLATSAGISTTAPSSTLQFTTTSATATSSIVVNGDITGNISINKGPGGNNSPNASLTFGTTAKTYTGATTISSGSFILNTSLVNTSGFTSAAGTVIRGTNGTINTGITANVNGTLSPGAATGNISTLTMGGLSLASTSTTIIDINSNSLATDVLNVTALNAAGALSVVDAGTTSLAIGQAILFIQNSGVWTPANGVFTVGGVPINNQSETFTVGANTYQIKYDYNTGGQTGVALIVVPEPSAVLLSALAGGGLLLRRRRNSTAC